MRKTFSLRTIFIIMVLAVIVYELTDGIRYQSAWGVTMAGASLVALVLCIRLFNKLAQLKAEEEEAG